MVEHYVSNNTGVVPPGIRLDITCELYATLTLLNIIYYGIHADLVFRYEPKPAIAV